MSTLLSAPVAPLLDRLFAHADATEPATTPSVADYWNGLSREERAERVNDFETTFCLI
jgi:hypothetical protein